MTKKHECQNPKGCEFCIKKKAIESSKAEKSSIIKKNKTVLK